MKVFKLIFKNMLRHKLRTFLTIVGMSIAVIAFTILRTVVTAWSAGVEASAPDRLIVRQSVSFIFSLPFAYQDKILAVPGVEDISYATWFGGNYINKDNFFARIALNPDKFENIYPEYMLTKTELEDFKRERNACVVGEDLAKQYGFKVGDLITLEGDIFPGQWEFVVRGVYKPKFKHSDATQMFFDWEYINERMIQTAPIRANRVGWYVVKIKEPNKSAQISAAIDGLFKNSSSETKTETEAAFTQGFVSALGAIITAINVMSFVIIGIIMLVLANTMVMSARERTREYAVMKTLGFSAFHLIGLILGEALLISALGGLLGLSLSLPLITGLESVVPKGFFPVFFIEPITIVLSITAVMLIGVLSSIFPIRKAVQMKIVDGFRFVG